MGSDENKAAAELEQVCKRGDEGLVAELLREDRVAACKAKGCAGHVAASYSDRGDGMLHVRASCSICAGVATRDYLLE